MWPQTGRSAGARHHVRAGDDRPQHASGRRARRLPEQRAASAPRRLAHRHLLPPRPRSRRPRAGRRVHHHKLAARARPVRHPRRRGRRRGRGRADVRVQARGVRAVGGDRRRRRRHPRHVRELPHRSRHVLDHRAALRRADVRPRRRTPLAGPRGGRGPHHGLALRLHRRPAGHPRPRGGRFRPHLDRPLAARGPGARRPPARARKRRRRSTAATCGRRSAGSRRCAARA